MHKHFSPEALLEKEQSRHEGAIVNAAIRLADAVGDVAARSQGIWRRDKAGNSEKIFADNFDYPAKTIAELWYGTTMPEERDANARLMAAGPLVAELVDLVRQLKEGVADAEV